MAELEPRQGVPEWVYPALGLPEPPAQAAAAAVPVNAEPTPVAQAGPARLKIRWETPVAVLAAVALVFLLGWWYGVRRAEHVPLISAFAPDQTPKDNLANLSDEELFALLPTKDDYPRGWRVNATRGASAALSATGGLRLEPAECDPRQAAKPADQVGSVKGESPRGLMLEVGSAEVRLARDPQGAGSFSGAEEFAKRCPQVILTSDGVDVALAVTIERDTVPGASESMTITMTGELRSPGSSSVFGVPITLSMTGARCRGLMLVGSGLRAGLDGVGSAGRASTSADGEPDVVGKLLKTTVHRIKQK